MKQKKQLFLPVLLPKIGLALLDALIVNIAVVSVSYTHLDVYKRQESSRMPPA